LDTVTSYLSNINYFPQVVTILDIPETKRDLVQKIQEKISPTPVLRVCVRVGGTCSVVIMTKKSQHSCVPT